MNEKTKAKAMIFFGPGQALEQQEFDLPVPKNGEVLVRIVCCTLCGSDIHSYTGNRSTPCPTVLGHEILGRVSALPPDGITDARGEQLQLGDRVTWSIAASCGDCFYCEDGLPQKCEHLFKYGHESIEKTYPLNGGLADYCLIAPGTAILTIPDALPDTTVCPVNCATSTVAAAMRLAGECKGKRVLISGAGMLGLTACAMAHSRGASEVIVSDVSNTRLETAKEFGATATANVGNNSDELTAVIQDRTNGRGVDISIELCGVNESSRNCIEQLRIGGICVCVGATFPSPPLPVSIESIIRGIKQIKGIHNYTPQDMITALDFLHEHGKHYPFDTLVGKTFSLDQTAEAFQYAIEHDVLRVAVIP